MTPRPRGHLAGVPESVRRLWSLLYRATRRQAVRIDALGRTVSGMAGSLIETSRRLDALDERVDELERRTRG